MTPNDHNSPPVAGMIVSIVEQNYLHPDYDPDLHEYDNAGDAWIVSEDRDE